MSAVREHAAGNGQAGAIITAALVAAIVLVQGCSSVTFKRGATPTTMTADERTCRLANPADPAYRNCMREKGWFVAGGSVDPESDPAATAMSDRAGTRPSPASPIIDFGAPPVNDPPPVNPPTVSKSPAMPTQSSSQTTSSVATTATPRQRPSSSAAVVSAPPSPLAATGSAGADEATLIGVASWWKFGGTAGGLDADIAACTEQLGDTHRPAPAATRVTRAMGACLRESGWYAVGKSSR